MHPQFACLTPHWFYRAYVYTGSIGDFRYRFDRDADANMLHTAVYSRLCYEVADDVQKRDFSWDDAGVEELKSWLQRQYEAFSQTGKLLPEESQQAGRRSGLFCILGGQPPATYFLPTAAKVCKKRRQKPSVSGALLGTFPAREKCPAGGTDNPILPPILPQIHPCGSPRGAV